MTFPATATRPPTSSDVIRARRLLSRRGTTFVLPLTSLLLSLDTTFRLPARTDLRESLPINIETNST